MPSKIHPSAIVDSKAIIGDNVVIGAYTIIGANVQLGDNTSVAHHVSITGNTIIGKNNRIFQFASIGEIPQDKKYQNEATQLEIGDNNTIREFCTLNIGTIQGGGITRVGNNNWIMAYCHIAHDCMVGDNTIFANGVALGGHVTIKNWTVLGGHVAVHQFCIIGDHAMIAGATAVAQDVPPYIIASGYRAEPKGVNVEGLKRRNFTQIQIEHIKHAYKTLYRSELPYSQSQNAIVKLAELQPELQPFITFFASSTRGIIR